MIMILDKGSKSKLQNFKTSNIIPTKFRLQSTKANGEEDQKVSETSGIDLIMKQK
jgi:hypothetical protein